MQTNWHESVKIFIDELGSSNPTPGGGAGGAVAGAMGCALAQMSASTTLKLKKTLEENKPDLQNFVNEIDKLKNLLTQASLDDAEVYQEYIETKKIPKDDDSRTEKMQQALINAAQVPLNASKLCKQAQEKIEQIESKISPIIMSDVICAKNFLDCAKKCLLENIKINLDYIKDEQTKKQIEQEVSNL